MRNITHIVVHCTATGQDAKIGICIPKFTINALSLFTYPTSVQPNEPVLCMNILSGYIFKFVSNIPHNIKAVLTHFIYLFIKVMISPKVKKNQFITHKLF